MDQIDFWSEESMNQDMGKSQTLPHQIEGSDRWDVRPARPAAAGTFLQIC